MKSRTLLNGIKALALFLSACAALTAHAGTALSDVPLFATTGVPGNLVLALSVEFPTAVTAEDRSSYSATTKYLGYFDPLKCYVYTIDSSAGGNGSYFAPSGATGTNYSCSGKWSGNFMNWATMQAVDPFRWALTGGYRNIDTTTTTILEKAWAPSNQGSPSNNFPHKTISNSGSFSVSQVTPFSESLFNMQVLRCGNTMLFRRTSTAFTNDSACPSSTAWDGVVSTAAAATVYSVQVRVQVCVAGSLEANCAPYGSNAKPQGLIQQYSNKIRYSAFGYLNDPAPTGGSMLRDGGVLRARMKYVGPTQPVPGSTAITNGNAEWSSTTGVFVTNPDPTDATNSSETGSVVANSGVINYLNQFGRSAQAYKYYDPVSELYYAATRYLRGLSNVTEYSDLTKFNGTTSTLANRTAMKDGFPVISTWTDPILYSCQKNFVLGIGDTNSNQDKDVPGNTLYRTNEPTTMPSALSSDNIDVIGATNKVGVIEGLSSTIGAQQNYNSSNNSAYIAGLAYMFHTNDMRSDMTGTQTIDTYWLDVLEGSDYKAGSAGNIGRNQFYLAAKYGGFTVPSGYSFATRTTILDPTLWSTNGQTIPIPVLPGSGNGPRPDNYFVANQPDKMVSGLSSAFQKIAATVDAFTTSFSTALPQVSNAGNASFSAKYDPSTWTGELTASELTFDTSGNPTVVTPSKWTFSAKLATQLASAGWNTGRRVVTYDGSRGVPFRATGGTGATHIAAADLAALDTSYTTGDDSSNYLNYLRGDQTNEAGGTGTQAYRKRTKLLGDIVGSKALAVSPPAFPYSDATNPGYSTFKSTWATRRTAVYVGSNDGILHAVNGALATASGTAFEWDANAGNEMWAYIPRALFQGPNGTPNADGLASLGNPSFTHHFMVNSTPVVFDADFSRTADDSGTLPATFASPNWKSVLVGGLGKGGRAYYAIDVTDPVSMAASETAAAGKVLWEFNNATTGVGGALGYTFGQAIMTKTRKYGWVVIVPSGYNNSDGQGYFFFVNPRTGALLEKVTTGTVATGVDAGLANLNAFIVDTTDGTIDAIYAGDLLGNLWRLDVTGTTGSYPAPTKMATLTDASSNPQPVTSRPSIQVHPGTKKRFVLLGTGRLLDDTDITSTQMQTYYAIADGTNGAFKPAADAPAMPYTRVGTGSVLANNSNLLNGVVFNPSTQVGWYTDLGKDAGTGIAWRVISDSTTLSGSVAFAAILPNGLVCSPSGTSQVYGVDYASAQTTLRGLVNGVMAPVASVAKDGTVTELHYISVNGKSVLVAGTNTGDVSQVPTAASAGLTVKRLNWRELQGGD